LGAENISLLSALEPILGVSVALNLAYLSISRFHYITIVKQKLRKRLDAIDQKVITSVQNTNWYCQLRDLASVDTIEFELPHFIKNPYINAPGFWGFFYNFFFYWRLGKILSVVGTVYSLFLLFLGAGHASTATEFLQDYFNTHINRHYLWSMMAAIWPVLSVMAGEYVSIQAARFVKYQTDNLRTQARTTAERAVAELNEFLSPHDDTQA
jgi:hypothetical protein